MTGLGGEESGLDFLPEEGWRTSLCAGFGEAHLVESWGRGGARRPLRFCEAELFLSTSRGRGLVEQAEVGEELLDRA